MSIQRCFFDPSKIKVLGMHVAASLKNF